MPRVRIVEHVRKVGPSNNLQAVSGATVQIYQRGTTTTPSIYAAETGGSPLTPPFTTDGSGRVIDEAAAALWADPQSLDIVATKGSDTYTIASELVSARDLGGRELGYAEIIAGFSTTTTSAYVDVTGLSTDVTVGVRPIVAEFFGMSIYHTAANANFYVAIREGATVLALTHYNNGAASEGKPAYCKAREALSAGAHTLKVSVFNLTAGTLNIEVVDGTTPASIQVVEC